ncbi:hypothetical protein FORC065_0681 [Yersinia enterocolitica]|nr:hypothetical protein FORC065_0681 [Yersinia enterocolitica]
MLQQQQRTFDTQPCNFPLLLIWYLTAYHIIQAHIRASLSIKRVKDKCSMPSD